MRGPELHPTDPGARILISRATLLGDYDNFCGHTITTNSKDNDNHDDNDDNDDVIKDEDEEDTNSSFFGANCIFVMLLPISS